VQDLPDFGTLGFRNLLDFGFLSLELGSVVFEIRARGEIAAEPHGERARRDLGETSRNDYGRRGHRSGKTRRESERDGKPIRQADDNVSDESRGEKVLFDMRRRRHGPPEVEPRFRQRRAGPSAKNAVEDLITARQHAPQDAVS
jgi:hypothetical protein